MPNFYLPASKQTPEIDFKFDENHLSMKGESYPENAGAFYGRVMEELRAYLSSGSGRNIVVDVALRYFNSASTKLVFKFVEELDTAASNEGSIRLNWLFEEEDDMLREFGENLQEDFTSLDINLQETTY
jgi:SiaC family regulatory phosphoprotein